MPQTKNYTRKVVGSVQSVKETGEVQWWQHAKPITFNPSDPDYRIPEWKDINLEFDKKKEKPQNKGKRKFNPTIIDGGKD